MLPGEKRDALLRVADQLVAEAGHEAGPELPGARSALEVEWGLLDQEDEALVMGIRSALARLAAAVSPTGPRGAVGAALDGAEMVMRGELLRGNAAELPSLMPSFVFLVALSADDHDMAIELSRRTSDLIRASAAGRNPGLDEEP